MPSSCVVSPIQICSFRPGNWSANLAKFILLYCAFSHLLFAETGPVILLQKEQQPCPLVLVGGTEADRSELARIATRCLEQMTGKSFPIQAPKADGQFPSPSLVLEITKSNESIKSDEGFRIRTEDGRVHVTATSRLGVHYGFYELMERLGCHFWSFNEEDIPELKTVQVEHLDYTWTPPFTMHDIMSREAQTPEDEFRNKSRSCSLLQFSGNHTLQPLLKPYSEKHPEILPLIQKKDKDGNITGEKREFNNLHYCYSHPHIAEALAEAMIPEIEKRGRDVRNWIYFAGMGDWYGGMCICERCQAIYDEETWADADGKKKRGYTGTLLRMINRTAEILEKKYPGIQVGTFAYMSLEAPSAITKPRDNVVIWIPRLRHCGVHSVHACEKNRSFLLNLQRWCELAPGRVYVWEYGVNYTNFLYPFPVLRAMAENIAAYHKMGVAGLMIQGNYVTSGGDMVVLNNYVWSRLMRQPSQPVEPLIDGFISKYYGPAAPAVREYIDVLEASTKEPAVIHADEFSEPLKTYLTKPVIKKLAESLSRAKESASEPAQSKYLQRVNELAVSLDVVNFWRPGPLGERDGRLIRQDFGYDTFPYVLELQKHSRGATLKEYGLARGYWLNFLKLHGGPIATLHNGGLTLKGVPVNSASMGPVSFNEAPVLTRTWLTAVFYGKFDGDLSNDVIRMEGEAGIGSWTSDTKHIYNQEIRCPDEHTIQIDCTVKRLAKGEQFASAATSVRTIYPTSRTQNVEFSWRGPDGEWHPTELPQPGKPAKVGQATAWRIRLPHLSVTDEYVLQADATPLSGELGVDSDTKRIYTDVAMRVDKLSVGGEAIPWLRRTIHIEPR
jgi:hypothetical protein